MTARLRRRASARGIALVDFDNYSRPSRGDDLRAAKEAAAGVVDVVDRVASVYRRLDPAVDGVDIRLYGGWLDEEGGHSPRASAVLQTLGSLPRRQHDVAVRPALALSMLVHPSTLLRGTVRLRARPRRQKMVDAMIGCDAIHLSGDEWVLAAVFTDDDDLVPALLACHVKRPGGVVWVRRSGVRSRPNDKALKDMGLVFADGGN